MLGKPGFRRLLGAIALSTFGCGTPAVPGNVRQIAGYPAARAEDLARFPPLGTEALAAPVVGQHYRIRYGILHVPDADSPVDARTGAEGFPADGPFEEEVRVAPEDVVVRVIRYAGATPTGEPVHRLLACVDLRPARLRNLGGALIVLNVAAAGAAVSVPYARDAVTGEPAPVPAEELLDEEQGTPCDRRPLARREWEDNRARRENRR